MSLSESDIETLQDAMETNRSHGDSTDRDPPSEVIHEALRECIHRAHADTWAFTSQDLWNALSIPRGARYQPSLRQQLLDSGFLERASKGTRSSEGRYKARGPRGDRSE